MWLKLLQAIAKAIKGKVKPKIKGKIGKYKIAAKSPGKYLQKKIINGIKSPYLKFNKSYKFAKRLFGKSKKISIISEKARILEQTTRNVNERLSGRTGVQIDTLEVVKQTNKVKAYLLTKSNNELDVISKTLDKELSNLGLDEFKTVEDIVVKMDEYNDVVSAKSYEVYMNSWYERFIDSDVEGIPQEEKEGMWSRIEDDKTYEWYKRVKLGE